MRAVVIYSGGMDSFTLLNEVLNTHSGEDDKIFALSFNYGQRHKKELEYAAKVCEELGVEHKVVDITGINSILQGSSLTSDIDVPEGHYAAENMKQTVVPNRNMILLSLAIGYAVSVEADHVFYGAHAGDHAIYPDCRPEFIRAMNHVAMIANYHAVHVHTPYLNMSKGDIAAVGRDLGLDYGKSWTCYNGRDKACGKCGACVERLEAMEFAGIEDPIEYE